MAYLNVRERRIETKIAYLGPQLSGKATNFGQLGGAGVTTRDDVLALDWKPTHSSTFRDCDVMVKLVATRGELEGDSLERLLRDADGVVFVADADPDAQDRNRTSLAKMKAALAARTTAMPVVVQVNKTDLPDALTAENVVSSLEATAWPHVAAAATRGEGVQETAERAILEVLEALRRTTAVTERDPERAQNTIAPRIDGNPLLSALREVLRETVREHVEELAGRQQASIEAKLETFFARMKEEGAGSNGEAAEVAALRRTLIEESARNRTVIDGMRERLDAVDKRVTELRNAVTSNAHESARFLVDLGTAVTTLDESVKSGAQPVDLRPQLERIRDEIRGEIVKTTEARSRADREHLASSTSALKRAIDGVAADVKGLDTKGGLTDIRTSLDAINTHTTAFANFAQPTAAALRAFAPRIAEVEATMQRELHEGLVRVVERLEERITALRDETRNALGATNTAAVQTQAILAEVVEEMKKPKKSWFG